MTIAVRIERCSAIDNAMNETLKSILIIFYTHEKKNNQQNPKRGPWGFEGGRMSPLSESEVKRCVWKCEMKEGPRPEEQNLQVCKQGERDRDTGNRDTRAAMHELHQAKMSASSA